MAEIKYLSAGSSQIFALLLRDKNKAPINANKIHMEGIIYTGNNKDKGYRFSINNGVVLGCTIQLDMIIFNINPLLPVGKVAVYTKTYIDNSNTPFGNTAIIENTQTLNIEIVKTGTFMSDRQGTMFDDLHLPIIVEDKMIAWEGNADILPEIKKYIKTTEFTDYIKTLVPGQDISNLAKSDLFNVDNKVFADKAKEAGIGGAVDISNKADKDLSNIDNTVFKDKVAAVGIPVDPVDLTGKADTDLRNVTDKDFLKRLAELGITSITNDELLKKAKEIGLLINDLSNVNLEKLKEQCFNSGMLGKDLGDINLNSLNEAILKTDAYKHLAAKSNQPVKNIVKNIHYEETNVALDFATDPHEFIHAVYRFDSPNQVITQVLPNADLGKTIIIDAIQMTDGCRLVLQPFNGQMISGSNKDVEIDSNGVQGIMYPETSGNYDWIPQERFANDTISIQDENGNIFLAKNGLKFIGADMVQTLNKEVAIEIHPTTYSNQNQGIGNQSKQVTVEEPLEFSPDINSAGKVTNVNLRLKRGSLQKAYPDAYYAALSEPILIHAETNKLHKGNIWFDDVLYNHGPFIQVDKTNKVYGIQEDDELDPNITGGTLAFVIVKLAFAGTAKQDGRIILELTDPTTGKPITYLNGREASIRRDYKKDQPFGYIQMAFPFEAKGLQLFQVEVKHNFEIDEVILEDRLNGNSNILICYAHKDNQINPAVTAWEVDNNQKLLFQKNYFGADLFDMKYLVQNNVGEKVIIVGTGGTVVDGAHFYNNTVMSTEVKDGVLKFIGDAPNNSFFTFGKIFSTEKTIPMRGKDIKVDVRVIPPTTPAEVVLYSWIGEPDKYDSRIYGEIINNQPVLVSGWTVIGKRDLIEGYDNFGMEFTVPSNSNNYAVCIQPKDVTNVTEINVTDLKVSAVVPFYDIQFEGVSEVGENYQINNTKKAVFGVDVTGYAGLRYSVGIGETKMPVGWFISSMSDIFPPVKLNPKWKDNVGHKGEGVLEVTRDCRIKNLYAILRMSGSDEKKLAPDSIQTVQVYFSKEDSTGINPIEQTRTSFESKTAEAPKYISTNKGSAFQPIEFKKGEFIWLYAICNYDDGAYFNSVKKGQYLIQTIIEWEEIEESPVVPLKNISELKFTKDGKEVASDNYGLEIDIDTGKITVTTK